MIRFDHVTRTYQPGGSPALEDVSVEFQRGDFVFLIGASGSGKSTLLRMILREGLPQQGKITVAGQNLSRMLERRVPEYRRSIGMVFQDFRLLPDKTVYANVAFAMRVIGASRTQIRPRVMKILSRVGLEHLAKRYPHEISGGEQQRAAIARAIVNSPAILLADEPTGNLDPRASEEVMKILRWINASGTTVVMATHDRPTVDRMRRRVVQLHRGRLVRDEPGGRYDPPEFSPAWELLAKEQEESGLRASDPAPQFTQAIPMLNPEDDDDEPGESAPAEPHERDAGPAGARHESPAADASRHKPVVPRRVRVTWPEDERPAEESSAADSPEHQRAETDAAEVPVLDDEAYFADTDPDVHPQIAEAFDEGDPPVAEPRAVPRPRAAAPEEAPTGAADATRLRAAETAGPSARHGIFSRKRR